MSEPTFSEATETLYASLPGYYRVADVAQGYALKNYVASIGEQYQDVLTLLDRVDYAMPDEGGVPGGTSDLVDPSTCDLAWLPWLAQLVGVKLDTSLSEAAQRDAVRHASSGWQGGTKSAVAAAAKSALTGTQYVTVYDHSTEVANGVGVASEWDVLIVTRESETPDPAAVLAAIVAKNAKPAGVTLHHLSYSASWSAVEADLPTWASIEALLHWWQIEEVGLT